MLGTWLWWEEAVGETLEQPDYESDVVAADDCFEHSFVLVVIVLDNVIFDHYQLDLIYDVL